jgi:hypothetical protein
MESAQSNADFFAIFRRLIEAWCDRRALRPLSRVLEPYLAFNGLTDGWGEILIALRDIRAQCREDISETELAALGELIRAAESAVHHDRGPK